MLCFTYIRFVDLLVALHVVCVNCRRLLVPQVEKKSSGGMFIDVKKNVDFQNY